MGGKKHTLYLLLPVSLIALCILACTVPKKLVTYNPFFKGNDDDKLEEAALDYGAEIVSSEGEILIIDPPHNTPWICDDIEGEISNVLASQDVKTYGLETMIVKKAFLDLTLHYKSADTKPGENNKIQLNFELDIERAEGTVDSDTETIIGWNQAHWTKGPVEKIGEVVDGNKFNISLDVPIKEEMTYPYEATYEKQEFHNFFGLISENTYQKIYLCDMRLKDIPVDLADLTEDNFRASCSPGYYYECDLHR